MQRTAEHLHAISRRLQAIEDRMTREVSVQATPELSPKALAPDPAIDTATAVEVHEPVEQAPVTAQPLAELADDHVASQETVEGGPDAALELESW